MSAVTERREGALSAATPSLPTVARSAFAVLRLVLAFEFLWAFFDKLLGLGRSTPSERAWVNGGQPTAGFLKGVEGPFKGFFNGLSGNAFVDVLFMLGLLGIGLALALGIGMRVAAVCAAVLLMMMWAASLPIATNPFLDEHWLEAIAIVGLAWGNIGETWGLGKQWAALPLVRKNPWLR
ncbi:DoxX family membrane protein [Xylanimonas protaetiae]|nr:DoxX family membrane protein [Xylanimonas protaetiae]